MIDDLRAMAIFVIVAETGSFSAAGRRLGLATSGVSQHVTKLENRLGVTLLYRSTRSLSLTNEGQRLFNHAQQMLGAAEAGLNSIVDVSREPSGNLSITMPTFMSGSKIEQAIWDFTRAHSAVGMTVRHLDRNDDLVTEGIDLAIRMGELQDSNLQSRRVGWFARKLVCAPSYLRTLPSPLSPEDLNLSQFIEMEGLTRTLRLVNDDKEEMLVVGRARIKVDSFSALRSALRAGLGIQRLPLSFAQEDLERGTLVEVLPGWSLPDLGTYCVWPDTSRRSSLARLLVDHIAETMPRW